MIRTNFFAATFMAYAIKASTFDQHLAFPQTEVVDNFYLAQIGDDSNEGSALSPEEQARDITDQSTLTTVTHTTINGKTEATVDTVTHADRVKNKKHYDANTDEALAAAAAAEKLKLKTAADIKKFEDALWKLDSYVAQQHWGMDKVYSEENVRLYHHNAFMTKDYKGRAHPRTKVEYRYCMKSDTEIERQAKRPLPKDSSWEASKFSTELPYGPFDGVDKCP